MIYKGLNGPHRAKMAKKPKTISVLAPPPYIFCNMPTFSCIYIKVKMDMKLGILILLDIAPPPQKLVFGTRRHI